MSGVTIAVIVALLGALYFKIKSFLTSKKTAKLKESVQEKRDEANKKVGAADSARDEFKRKLQQYRDKKQK